MLVGHAAVIAVTLCTLGFEYSLGVDAHVFGAAENADSGRLGQHMSTDTM